jgi:hypothetical protein
MMENSFQISPIGVIKKIDSISQAKGPKLVKPFSPKG